MPQPKAMPEQDLPKHLPLPATSTEIVNALAHFHRAEMGRMSDWRGRIDRTSNWAITVVAGMLSISLSTPSSHHGVLLFAMLLVFLLLWIEARRYRFFDIYRARVRQFERHYFAQIFDPRPGLSVAWPELLAQSLREPSFQLSHWMAMSRRLRRNYIWMFLILLFAWILKITSPRLQDEAVPLELAQSFAAVIRNADLGPVPGWMVIACVVAFFGFLAFATFVVKPEPGELSYGKAHM
jgi:uncharacterized membrane protein